MGNGGQVEDLRSQKTSAVSRQPVESEGPSEASLVKLTDNDYCVKYIETVYSGNWVIFYEYNKSVVGGDQRVVLLNLVKATREVLMEGSEEISLIPESKFRPVLFLSGGQSGILTPVFGYEKREGMYLYVGGVHRRIGVEMFPRYSTLSGDYRVTLQCQLVPYDDGVLGLFMLWLPSSVYFTYGQREYPAFHFIGKINHNGAGEVIYGPRLEWRDGRPLFSIDGPMVESRCLVAPVLDRIVFQGVDPQGNTDMYVFPGLRILPQVLGDSELFGRYGVGSLIRVDEAWDLGVREGPVTDMRVLVYDIRGGSSRLLDPDLNDNVGYALSADHKKIVYIQKGLKVFREIDIGGNTEGELAHLDTTIDPHGWAFGEGASKAYGPVSENGERVFFAVQEGFCNNLYMLSRTGWSGATPSAAASQERLVEEAGRGREASSEGVPQGRRLMGINYEECISPCIETGECVEGSRADEEWWYGHMREKQEIINRYWEGEATEEEALLATIQQKLAGACYERANRMRLEATWLEKPDPEEVLGEEYYRLYLDMAES
jgi:hypothetical protein